MNSVRSTEEGGEETSPWQGFPEVSEASFGGSRGMVLSPSSPPAACAAEKAAQQKKTVIHSENKRNPTP